MKSIVYILSALLLVFNFHLNQPNGMEFVFNQETESSCNMTCCTTNSSEKENTPKCCTEAVCTSTCTTSLAFNFGQSIVLPFKKFEPESNNQNTFYSNNYTFYPVIEFWNPPRLLS